MHIWTVEEIQNITTANGWFYGFIRYEGKLYFSEIYPGLGFAQPNKGRIVLEPWYHPKAWYWAIRDIFRYKPE